MIEITREKLHAYLDDALTGGRLGMVGHGQVLRLGQGRMMAGAYLIRAACAVATLADMAAIATRPSTPLARSIG